MKNWIRAVRFVSKQEMFHLNTNYLIHLLVKTSVVFGCLF